MLATALSSNSIERWTVQDIIEEQMGWCNCVEWVAHLDTELELPLSEDYVTLCWIREPHYFQSYTDSPET